MKNWNENKTFLEITINILGHGKEGYFEQAQTISIVPVDQHEISFAIRSRLIVINADSEKTVIYLTNLMRFQRLLLHVLPRNSQQDDP